MKNRFHILLLVALFTNYLSFGQENDKLIQVKPYVGLSSPQGDFKDFSNSGSLYGLSIDKYLGKKFALGIDINLQSNKHETSFDFSSLSAPYSITNNRQANWSSTSLSIGPTYKISGKKFFTELYAKAGITLLNSPSANAVFESDFSEKIIYDLQEQNQTNFGLVTGLRINYWVSPKLSLFFNPQFVTTFTEIEYVDSGISFLANEANDPLFVFDQESVNKTIKPSYLNVSAGLSINIGRKQKLPNEDVTNNNINLPFCVIKLDTITCKRTTPILRLTSNWSGFNSNYSKHIEVYSGTTLINTNMVGNNSTLGSTSGTFSGNATVSGYGGSTLRAVVIIKDPNGNIVCTSPDLIIQVPVCSAAFVCESPSIDPDDFTCGINTITYNQTIHWSNAFTGTLLEVEATQGNTNVPITTSQSMPMNVSGNGTTTVQITIPSSYAGTAVTIRIKSTNPSTGQVTYCNGGSEFIIPECDNGPMCELLAEAVSCTDSSNGKTEVNVTTNWANYTNPTAYTKTLYLYDANGNLIDTTFLLPNNGSPLTVNSGSSTYNLDLSGFAGKVITIILKICGPGGKDCCIKEFKIKLPQCCINCYDIELENSTYYTNPNIVANEFPVTGYFYSKPVKKVVFQLESFVCNDLAGAPITSPSNFEFTSGSLIGGTAGTLIGSLTNRSTMIVQNLQPNTTSVNFKLLIDNYQNKRVVNYKIKLTTFFADGTYCEQYL